jgi:serine 3-dehydrogenase
MESKENASIAWITGATSGIGKACAIKFAKAGWDLIITGRRLERLIDLQKELQNNYSVNIIPLSFDVRNAKEVETALGNLPAPTILINNAGLSRGLDPLAQSLLSDMDEMIDTNLKGLAYVSRIAAQKMIPHKRGHILHVGSIAGIDPYANGTVYCATKAGVDALTQALRMELLDKGIKVSVIHPGMVETEFSEVRFHGDTQRAANVYQGVNPLTPEEVADVIYYIIQQPAHVVLSEVVILSANQAGARMIHRNH